MSDKIKIGLIGVNGRMCRAVITSLMSDSKQDRKIELVTGVEKDSSILIGKRFEEIPGLAAFGELAKIKVHKNIVEVKEDVDVWVDFSLPEATLYHLEFLSSQRAAYVIGTTGFTPAQLKMIKRYSRKSPLVMSGNFSIGINLMLYLLEELLQVSTADHFDIEVQETHHRMKVDAPSGTGRMILDKILQVKKLSKKYLIYRDDKNPGPRNHNEIGVSYRRGGGVVGEHEVSLFGDNEVLSLKHTAINRSAFSYGVFEAIKFIYHKLESRENGLFGIKDVLCLHKF